MVSVRVTQNMLNNTMLQNLHRSYRSMDKYQDQLSSGKIINKPSDNPVIASRSMFYRTTLVQIEQYKRNSEEGMSWIEITDEALDQVTNVMHRVRELTVQGSNETYEQTSKEAIAKEIEQIKEHIGEIANTKMGDRYIFAGTDTVTENPPYDKDSNAFTSTNDQDIQREIGQGNFLKINVNGVDVFPGIINALDNIVNDLNSGGNPGQRLAELDDQMDNLLKQRAIVGSNMNRMEMILSRLDKTDVTTKKLLSVTEDADIAQVITDLKAQENVHRSALSAGARIIQPTLMDFLR